MNNCEQGFQPCGAGMNPAGHSGWLNRMLSVLLLLAPLAASHGHERIQWNTCGESDLTPGRHNTNPLAACTGYNPRPLSFTTPVSGGSPPYLYQWQLNGFDLPGETSDTLDPPRLDTAGLFLYNCRITDQEGTVVFTEPKSIHILPDPEVFITGDGITCRGRAILLQSNIVGGTGTYSFQWQSSAENINFSDISGADMPDYVPDVNTAKTLFYRVRIYPKTGSCNNATSADIAVTVLEPPATSPIYHL